MDLTDEQWEILAPLFDEPQSMMGRPRRPSRPIFDAVLWVLRTGAPWHDLPRRYPPYQTCHRRFQAWVENGNLKEALVRLRQHLEDVGGVNDVESFIDGTYAGAKKGDRRQEGVVPVLRRRSWRLQTAMVFLNPLASQMVHDTTSSSSTKRSMKHS